jgi:hypothetical protein
MPTYPLKKSQNPPHLFMKMDYLEKKKKKRKKEVPKQLKRTWRTKLNIIEKFIAYCKNNNALKYA